MSPFVHTPGHEEIELPTLVFPRSDPASEKRELALACVLHHHRHNKCQIPALGHLSERPHDLHESSPCDRPSSADLYSRIPVPALGDEPVIECDGASYHSCHTARDRDRLRQQHLEALGWRFHRIWSTDWYVSRQAEIERALRAYELAVRRADRRGNEVRIAEEFSWDDVSREGQESAITVSARPKPAVPAFQSIDDYPMSWLVQLAGWIESDGQNRTVDELIGELMDILPFRRRGSKIVARLKEAISLARTQPGAS